MARKVSSQPTITLTKTMAWMLALGYFVFLVAQSTYRNYQVNQQIASQKVRIAELERTKRNLELSLVYYRSNAFKEIEARRRLTLKGPGENVVALPNATTEPQLTIQRPVPKSNETIQIAPLHSWWRLFFG